MESRKSPKKVTEKPYQKSAESRKRQNRLRKGVKKVQKTGKDKEKLQKTGKGPPITGPLVLAVAAIHTTLQASHYLPVRELRQTFNEEFPSAAHFAYL